MTEYMAWYESGTQMVRCLDCGAMLSSGDTELHSKWHEKIRTLALGTANSLEMIADFMEAHP